MSRPKNTLSQKSIDAVNRHGALLVYPIKNKKEPMSLWSALFPRSEMVWAWDEDSDNRVAQLWHLREELSRSGEVIYSKWYQGRATFFSKDVFVALSAWLRPQNLLSSQARDILEVLEQDSPISTKEIKAAVDLQGRSLEGIYNKAMKELWNHFLILGFGEVEDSSFPSLAVGATKLLFEDLWRESQEWSETEAEKLLLEKLGPQNPFFRYALKIRQKSAPVVNR